MCEIPNSIINEVIEELEKSDRELMRIDYYSSNPKERHMFKLMVQNSNTWEYAVYLYNDLKKTFNRGKDQADLEDAYEEFVMKGADPVYEYEFSIVEELRKTAKVKASSCEQARKIVEDLYMTGCINLDGRDFNNREIFYNGEKRSVDKNEEISHKASKKKKSR